VSRNIGPCPACLILRPTPRGRAHTTSLSPSAATGAGGLGGALNCHSWGQVGYTFREAMGDSPMLKALILQGLQPLSPSEVTPHAGGTIFPDERSAAPRHGAARQVRGLVVPAGRRG